MNEPNITGLLPRRKYTDLELSQWVDYIKREGNKPGAQLSAADYIKKDFAATSAGIRGRL